MAACAFLLSCHDFSAQILELSALAGLLGSLPALGAGRCKPESQKLAGIRTLAAEKAVFLPLQPCGLRSSFTKNIHRPMLDGVSQM
jgi:hypothetical protein